MSLAIPELERQAKLRQIEIERPKLEKMRVILADQLIHNAVIERTVNEEWALIKDSGVLDNLVPDEGQQEEIRSFLHKNYVELSDCYKFYSAVNSGGGTHTLEFIELNKFLSETSILGEEHSSAVLRIFIDSHISAKNGKKSKASIHSEIHRHEFLLALIKISIFKFITLPKKEIARLKRLGQQIPNSKRNVPTAPKALELVYEQHLAPGVLCHKCNVQLSSTLSFLTSTADLAATRHVVCLEATREGENLQVQSGSSERRHYFTPSTSLLRNAS